MTQKPTRAADAPARKRATAPKKPKPAIPSYAEMAPHLGSIVTVTVTSRGLAKRGDRGSKRKGVLVGYQRRGDGPSARILHQSDSPALAAFLASDEGKAIRQRADVCLVLVEEEGVARVHTPRVQHVQLPRQPKAGGK